MKTPSAAKNTSLDAHLHDHDHDFEDDIDFDATGAPANARVIPADETRRSPGRTETQSEVTSQEPASSFDFFKLRSWGFGFPSLVVWGDRYR